MKALIASTAALAALFSGVLSAADPQLLNLVMPDVKVMADINVEQAKTSPFGQYVLAQVQPQQLMQIAAITGFDPVSYTHLSLARMSRWLVGSSSSRKFDGTISMRASA